MTIINRKIWLCVLGSMRRAKRLEGLGSLAAILIKGLFLGLLAVGCAHQPVRIPDSAAQMAIPSRPPEPAKRANFEREQKSREAQQVADWAVHSSDNQGMPFVIVDKIDAKVFVFDVDGRLRGAAPCLLGMAKGDDSIPGIGSRKLSDVRPEERTTPAGRFQAMMGYNYHGKDILWVDYEGAVSMHRVVTSKPAERRLERLQSPTPLDNRISFGCINVPVDFFNEVLKPAFLGTNGIVYVLPEIRTCKEFFTSYYDVDVMLGNLDNRGLR